MSLKNFGGGPERSQRVPPNPEGQAGSPNPKGKVNKGGGIGRRDFLKLVGIGIGAAGLAGLGLEEHNKRKKHEETIAELLGGAVFAREIRGMEIYVENSLPGNNLENDLLSKGLIESLEPMISILPDEMVRRTRRIVLETNPYDPLYPRIRFAASWYIIGIGMRFRILYPEYIGATSPQIQDLVSEEKTRKRLERGFFHGAASLSVFGGPESSRLFREPKLKNSCQESINDDIDRYPFVKECIDFIDLIDQQSLKRWFQISYQNGGYVDSVYADSVYARMTSFDTYLLSYKRHLIGYRNFGYIDDPEIRYGHLNPAQDIACVFYKILSSLYKVIYRNEDPKKNEDPKTVISDLLSETQGETGLHEKYLIACESLIKWYGENSDQSAILREFIQIIADAIKEAERSY